MTLVLEVCGFKEEAGTRKYKCMLGNKKVKWLERHKIANFNEVANQYAEIEKVSAKEVEEIAKETRAVYNFLLEKKGNSGVRAAIKRKGQLMYVYENDKKEIEVLYSREDIYKHAEEVFDFLESKIKFDD